MEVSLYFCYLKQSIYANHAKIIIIIIMQQTTHLYNQLFAYANHPKITSMKQTTIYGDELKNSIFAFQN